MNTTNSLGLAKPNPFRLLLKWLAPAGTPPSSPSLGETIPKAAATDPTLPPAAPRKKPLSPGAGPGGGEKKPAAAPVGTPPRRIERSPARTLAPSDRPRPLVPR